jgi:hypothetical protein
VANFRSSRGNCEAVTAKGGRRPRGRNRSSKQ